MDLDVGYNRECAPWQGREERQRNSPNGECTLIVVCTTTEKVQLFSERVAGGDGKRRVAEQYTSGRGGREHVGSSLWSHHDSPFNTFPVSVLFQTDPQDGSDGRPRSGGQRGPETPTTLSSVGRHSPIRHICVGWVLGRAIRGGPSRLPKTVYLFNQSHSVTLSEDPGSNFHYTPVYLRQKKKKILFPFCRHFMEHFRCPL